MRYKLLFVIWAIALAPYLQGCTTIYRHDTAGNTTCVSYGIPGLSSFTVTPPIISNTGEVYGCPRSVVVAIAASNNVDSIHYTSETTYESSPRSSPPTVASPPYKGPFLVDLRKSQTLHVRAITADQCGGVSKVATQDFRCVPDELTTPTISHWFLFFGREYDDVIYEGAQLPLGCIVTDIHLQLVDRDGAPVGDYAHPESDQATDGHGGVILKSYIPLGGRGLELKVHSWHYAFNAVRYHVAYLVRGTNCSLPPFNYRTE